ncbi:RNA-binding domain-containing protein [uncultured Desulfuromonas sp.]|uniref:RNA-binding domain-containing protein n=1 Tax=uncultured Desulfuromonas sp. TaxID=181013 RepID=UPI002AAA8E50|nr:RNA-binding domain-containing protein [uncultured Desulfuromonas sp.]
MLEITTLDDITALKESFDIECKLATGKDRKGELPKDFWPTYSAFANTEGGDIFLGIKEHADGHFEPIGIADLAKVKDELWTGLNNRQKVSCNLLRERWVMERCIDGKSILQIHVPRAPRKQKPVYLRNNPITGTYKRLNSSDCLVDEESVRRMLAEQIEDTRDNEVLKGYGVDDLDLDSFNAYRQIYSNREPDHPWNQVDAQDFLYNIGAWRKDREAGHSGLTRAGLLMFGRLPAIKEAFPNYMLDYQERPEAKTEPRWIDRLTLDGSWSGNVFDFYRKVIRKLTADLKIPFLLDGDQRQDDTLVHKALREALVNTLVHADYTGRASILIVKRPDMFGFRNPGGMRIPREFAIRGGESDCRNRLLQDLFRYIGLGENAGSGLPKIYQGWSSQHWRQPVLREKDVPSEQTLEILRNSLGKQFDRLSQEARLILVTAQIEKTVDHSRMIGMMDIHPHDLTKLFASLTEKGFLLQDGSGRGTIYCLPETRYEDDWEELRSRGSGGRIGGLGDSSGGSGDLQSIAAPVATKKRAPKTEMERVILALCAQSPLTLEQLHRLLNRSTEVLRKDYLQPMVKTKKLRYRYPTKPNHPEQAYITAKEGQ